MIQFNLLPDVKLEYLRTRRTKRMVTMASTIVAAASLAILILLFIAVNLVQKRHLDNLSRDIAADSQTLQEIPDLDKILTVQNQLYSLSGVDGTQGLHSLKPQVTRLDSYLQQVIPANVTLAEFAIDFNTQAVNASGSADNLAAVNKLVDTLKFTSYKYQDTTSVAFSDVVLTSFTVEGDRATYQISLRFDPAIFDSSKEISLIVPKTVTTRSSTDRPEALFQALPTEGDQ